MFKLGNIFDGGYSAHSVVKRSYDRIDDSIEAIASGDSTDAGTASVIISSLLSSDIAGGQQAVRNAAAEIAIETMGRIQAESVVLLQIQGRVAAAKALQLLAAA